MTENLLLIGEPKRKFRVVVQERKSKGSKIERCRSFMVYDYEGHSIDEIAQTLRGN